MGLTEYHRVLCISMQSRPTYQLPGFPGPGSARHPSRWNNLVELVWLQVEGRDVVVRTVIGAALMAIGDGGLLVLGGSSLVVSLVPGRLPGLVVSGRLPQNLACAGPFNGGRTPVVPPEKLKIKNGRVSE